MWHRRRRRGWGGRTAGEGRHYICAGPSNRAQYRPDRRRVYTAVVCVWTCETRVKPPPLPSPSPSPPPPPRTSTSGAPARVRSTRDAYSSSPTPSPVSSCLRVSIYIYIYLSLFQYLSIRISLHVPYIPHPPIVARRRNFYSPAHSINNNGERERVRLRTRVASGKCCAATKVSR